MIKAYFSNQIETLTARLVEQIGDPDGDVFRADEVIVHSTAHRRYLSLAIARRQQIFANVKFSFLARWLWRQIGKVVPEVPEQSPFATVELSWRVFGILGQSSWVNNHPRLSSYLSKADPLMRYELAQQIARTFEQYTTYRTDWLSQWAQGQLVKTGKKATAQDEQWQMELWCKLAEQIPTAAEIDPIRTFESRLSRVMNRDNTELPPVIHVFCLPAMPPLHLQLIKTLGQYIDVHIYVLNPCREYWFDLIDRKKLSSLEHQGKDQLHEEGHRLLAGWGKQIQSHLTLLLDSTNGDIAEEDSFSEPTNINLLGTLQRSILSMQQLEKHSIPLSSGDRSIEFHICHSFTREVEVLHNRLLSLFSQHPEINLSDVLVVTPNIEKAAPIIDAVFKTAPNERNIKYTITGRPGSQANLTARALLDLISAATSRFKVSEISALLQQKQIGDKFAIDEGRLEKIRHWLHDADIHWGLDADHKTEIELPAVSNHTFMDGLSRLFLGYTLPSNNNGLFFNLIAEGNVEGSEAITLGQFALFIDQLRILKQKLSRPLLSTEWCSLLHEIIATFILIQEDQWEDLRDVEQAIDVLGEQLQRSELKETLPITVIRNALTATLDETSKGGTPSGNVTFSSMNGLRNLPYKVICAIGMNDGDFPIRPKQTEFDLMAWEPRLGDRQQHHDDRNIFLDLLLAAREYFYISYVGFSIKDNSPKVPSILVSELLEYLLPCIRGHSEENIGDANQSESKLIIKHPLQAFSESSFLVGGDIRIRSFQREYAEALRAKKTIQTAYDSIQTVPVRVDNDNEDDEEYQNGSVNLTFMDIDAQLPPPTEEWRNVTLQQLQKFFTNPCEYLLKNRLKINTEWQEDQFEDSEPLTTTYKLQKELSHRLLPALMANNSLDDTRILALASTKIPSGALGSYFLEEELYRLGSFSERAKQLSELPILPPLSTELSLTIHEEKWQIKGTLSNLRESGLFNYNYSKIATKTYIIAWIEHLFLCTLPSNTIKRRHTHYLGLDKDNRQKEIEFKFCENPHEVLTTLVKLYRHGLQTPLYFFPKTAWEYMKKGQSIQSARAVWSNSQKQLFSEQNHPAYKLLLRGRPDPLSGEALDFIERTHDILVPLLDHLMDQEQA